MSEEIKPVVSVYADELEEKVARWKAKFDNMPPEEKRRREEEAKRWEAEDHQNQVTTLRHYWGVPIRHEKCRPQFTGEWNDKLVSLTAKLGTGFMVALVGGRGNGKTQLGVELIKTATQNLKEGLFTTAAEFFIAVKGSYKKDAKDDEAAVMRRYRKPSLLVVDEIGKRGETDWENTMLFELLNKRYGDMTDTVMVDNRTKADFISTIGPSLASRMQETGGIIECNWHSFRV